MSRSKTGLYFGVDIMAQFEQWWRKEGAAQYRERYGNAGISFVALNPAVADMYDQGCPLDESLYELLVSPSGTSEEEAEALHFGPAGLLNNVAGKLRFVIRTGLDSVEAETRTWLLEEGDFPFQGAGTHRGFKGGVSGLAKEKDWEVFCWLIDKICELRAAAASTAIQAMKNRDKAQDGEDPTTKYLGGTPQSEDWIEERRDVESVSWTLAA